MEVGNVAKDCDEDVQRALRLLRAAIVVEQRERVEAPFEAKLAAQRRIEDAHRETIQWVRTARSLGATKTMIAAQLGVQNFYRVNKMIEEAELA